MKQEDFETVDKQKIFDGVVVRLFLEHVRLPNGLVVEREIVRHWGAVAMVALDEEEWVYLVRQYRHPAGGELVEIPAGKLEQHENPLECAKRELMEEISFSAAEWHKLATFYTSPGFSDEMLQLYLARSLEPVEGFSGDDEEEFMEVLHLPLAEALAMVERGDIQDSKTIIGLALTTMHLKGMYETG